MTDPLADLNRHDLCCALEDLALIQALGNQEDLIDQARIMLSADKVEIERLNQRLVDMRKAFETSSTDEERRLRAALERISNWHEDDSTAVDIALEALRGADKTT